MLNAGNMMLISTGLPRCEVLLSHPNPGLPQAAASAFLKPKKAAKSKGRAKKAKGDNSGGKRATG